jgi:aspartate aminotransferase
MKNLMQSAGTMGGLAPSATLALTAKAKALQAAGENVVSLCAGEPDFDTPEHIKEAAIAALRAGDTKYTPNAGTPALREAIAAKLVRENGFACKAGQVVVGPGGKFSCFSTIAALCGPGDEVILPAPYWLSYPEMIRAAGATPVVVPCRAEDNYELCPDALAAAVTDRTRLLILNSPSNPTGAVYRRRSLAAIAAVAVARQFMVLADEIYEKLTYDADFPHVSIASFGPEIAALTITANGFSKVYSMTGWRLGYLAAPEWLAKRIDALQSHTTSNATSFAQAGALAALKGDQAPVEAMRQAFAVRRDLIHGLMSAIPGVRCIKPQGAFYLLCDISAVNPDAMAFSDQLLAEAKTAVVPCDAFGVSGHIRLSYACSEQVIRESAKRIGEFCRAHARG